MKFAMLPFLAMLFATWPLAVALGLYALAAWLPAEPIATIIGVTVVVLGYAAAASLVAYIVAGEHAE